MSDHITTGYTIVVTRHADRWTVSSWDCSYTEFATEEEAKRFAVEAVNAIPGESYRPARAGAIALDLEEVKP